MGTTERETNRLKLLNRTQNPASQKQELQTEQEVKTSYRTMKKDYQNKRGNKVKEIS